MGSIPTPKRTDSKAQISSMTKKKFITSNKEDIHPSATTSTSVPTPEMDYPHAQAPEWILGSVLKFAISNSPSNMITPRKIATYARTFSYPTTNQGFQFLYLPTQRKYPIKEMRTRLGALGIEKSRIIHIY
ncbi:hypothetical protein MFLAVUS_004377 [Mucor flavus]|uniref:Uncharacterized protein n=1 Tax=Mucor flavus TaxID=439312 RepID=A0ABP9YVT9_9FUNG